jgi:hypothetical protein
MVIVAVFNCDFDAFAKMNRVFNVKPVVVTFRILANSPIGLPLKTLTMNSLQITSRYSKSGNVGNGACGST